MSRRGEKPVGKLRYGNLRTFEIDDDLLPFLRVLAMNKLRRGEAFMLTVPATDGSGGRYSLWVSPEIPLTFQVNAMVPKRDEDPRELIEQLMLQASGPDGLDLTPYTTLATSDFLTH
jgi:hypothetical protein